MGAQSKHCNESFIVQSFFGWNCRLVYKIQHTFRLPHVVAGRQTIDNSWPQHNPPPGKAPTLPYYFGGNCFVVVQPLLRTPSDAIFYRRPLQPSVLWHKARGNFLCRWQTWNCPGMETWNHRHNLISETKLAYKFVQEKVTNESVQKLFTIKF